MIVEGYDSLHSRHCESLFIAEKFSPETVSTEAHSSCVRSARAA